MLILDTDHLGELQKGTSQAAKLLTDRLEASFDRITTTIISFEEQMRGWLASIHREHNPHDQIVFYARLQQLFESFQHWEILPWDHQAAAVFERLRKKKVRIGTMDLKIASISLANDAILLSSNLRDFEKEPDLRLENWLR